MVYSARHFDYMTSKQVTRLPAFMTVTVFRWGPANRGVEVECRWVWKNCDFLLANIKTKHCRAI